MQGLIIHLLLIRNDSNELEEIKADRFPVGMYFIDDSFTTKTLNLKKGDQIYLTTDGYADQFGGPEKKKFKSINLHKLLVANKELSLSDQKMKLESVFDDWNGSFEQIDDVCILGIKILVYEKNPLHNPCNIDFMWWKQ